MFFKEIFYGNRTKWSSVRSVIIRVLQHLPTAKQESDLFNHEYDYRLNWTEFLLPINYNHYNFRENMIFLCNCPIAGKKNEGHNFLDFSQIMTNWTTFGLKACSKHKSSKGN